MAKSKDQKILEFLESLQREYTISDIRRKTYPKKKDKEYYKRVMNAKMEKIRDICLRNSLPSIFTNSELEKSHIEKIYGWGSPDFYYTSEVQRDELRRFDITNYFSNESDVLVRTGNGNVKGVIVDNSQIDYQMFKGIGDIDDNTMGVMVKLRGEPTENMSLLRNIKRIL